MYLNSNMMKLFILLSYCVAVLFAIQNTTLDKSRRVRGNSLSKINNPDVLLNIENIDFRTFREKVDAIMDHLAEEEMKVMMNNNHTKLLNDVKEYIKQRGNNVTLKNAVLTRMMEDQLAASEKSGRRKEIINSGWNYKSQYRYRLKRTACDNMLMLIYMARHKLLELESNRYFNRKATAFRVAYLYRHLGRILHKMRLILAWHHHIHKQSEWTYIVKHIKLHQRAVRLHIDFIYRWWALVRIDGEENAKNKEHPTKKQ